MVPEPGAVLIGALQDGEPLASATARASRVAGTEVDGEDFVSGLAAAGLLMPMQPQSTPAQRHRSRDLRWIEGVDPAMARRLFGRTAWAGYGLAAGLAVVALIVRPDLRPTYEHWWWLPDPILSLLLLLPIQLLLAGCHEAWHWLAGRAVGVPAAFRFSYRGVFVVFETDLTQLVTVPRRRRYGPFLAGMAFDLIVLGAALALRLAHRVDLISLPGLLDRLLAALVLIQVLGIAWQWAALAMRSDGYAVVATALGCHDLYRATWLTTKDTLWRLSDDESHELAAMSAHDRRVARWFWMVQLAGILGMAWLMAMYAIPFLVSMLQFAGHTLMRPSLTSLAFWEAVAVVVVVAGQYAAVPALAWRERRRRRAGALR